MKIGHGGRKKDHSRDEADGYDETLIPVDFQTCGQFRDDFLFQHLVRPMQAGVFVTSIMDCCHSGTVLDLPYQFKADEESDSMQESEIYCQYKSIIQPDEEEVCDDDDDAGDEEDCEEDEEDCEDCEDEEDCDDDAEEEEDCDEDNEGDCDDEEDEEDCEEEEDEEDCEEEEEDGEEEE